MSQALLYFDEFLNLTLQINDPEQIKIAAKKLTEVYENLGDQKSANAYHKIYNESINDSMSFSIEKYKDLYLIEKERELSQIKRSSRRNLSLLAFCLLGVILLISYFFKKHKDRIEGMIEAQKTRVPGKKIVVNEVEIQKIKTAINEMVNGQLFLASGITRKSFCVKHKIKSERYLSHYINNQYKISFTAFLNDLRVEYAFDRFKKDAVFRNYKIEEIAKTSGFGSKKSFERAFSAKYGKSPYKHILSITD